MEEGHCSARAQWRVAASVPAESVQLRLPVDGVALLTDAVQLAEHHQVEHAATLQLGERALAVRRAPVGVPGRAETEPAGWTHGQQADERAAEQSGATGRHALQPVRTHGSRPVYRGQTGASAHRSQAVQRSDRRAPHTGHGQYRGQTGAPAGVYLRHIQQTADR